jgi:hypothetical protein
MGAAADKSGRARGGESGRRERRAEAAGGAIRGGGGRQRRAERSERAHNHELGADQVGRPFGYDVDFRYFYHATTVRKRCGGQPLEAE